jgi:phosphoglycerate dehydrogenase-like enzyme
MRIFRMAFTGDFQNTKGQSAYGDIRLDLLDGAPFIQYGFTDDHAPRVDDPGYWDRLYSLEVTAEHIADLNGLVVLRPWVKRGAFARGAPNLVAIGRSGAGYDKIDVAACTENDVALFNAPRALNHSTASTALLFMLALSKRLFAQDRITRQGRWDLQSAVMGSELTGRTLGIVGLGHSGRELVRLAAPFRMRIIAFSPHADPVQAEGLGVRLTALEKVLAECDFLSIHARLASETKGLIGGPQLALMKPTAYLINVARGEIVDQRALVECLRQRRIAGAGLDVFAVEPLPANDPLTALDNVILTPHWSPATVDIWKATGQAMSAGMLRAAQGVVPENVVNREVLTRPGFMAKLARFAENRPPQGKEYPQ